MRELLSRFREIKEYPSAIAGMIIILFLVGLALYALIAVPYSEAVRLWRGAEAIWREYPRNARPVFYDWFTARSLPRTIVLDTREDPEAKEQIPLSDDLKEILVTLSFDYTYDGFPKELSLFLKAEYETNRPFVSFLWRTPDGREIQLRDQSVAREDSYTISQDTRLTRRLGGVVPHQGLFMDPNTEVLTPLKGTYELVIEGLVFEEGSDIDVRLIAYGQVHGMAGTDHRRRDITVALLWGTPVALAFGFLAAVGSTILTLIIAAIGSWYRKWVDGMIQRITEVVMILPVLPILVMIGMMYSRSIWAMLGAIILLGIFSAGIKIYRAMFIQVRESPFIEAARAYGASGPRIIFRYMIPRIIPMLIPQFVILIPGYVFLEATLAMLGLADPRLPTWGKILYDAQHNGALYMGHYYWVIMPSLFLIITGLGFSMLGFALDRIFNPRLRRL